MRMIRENLVAVGSKQEWHDTVDALWKYHRRDYEDSIEVLQDTFPKTWDQRQLRVLPFIYRLAKTMSILYRRPPSRRFLRPVDEFGNQNSMPPQIARNLRKIYESINVDEKMLLMQEHLSVLNNACLLVVPTKFDGIRLLVVPPHHVEFDLSDPTSTDVRDVDALYISLPLPRDPATDIIMYGIAEITKDRAVWKSAPSDLEGKGLWSKDGSNPLGRIPVIYLRGTEPAPGDWEAPAPADLLHSQRSINLAITDILHIASMQGYGQPVITGMNESHAEQITLGPETVIGLPSDDQSFSFESGNPPISEYMQAAESHVNALLSHLGLDPAAFFSRGSLTAAREAMMDRDIERHRWVSMFQRAEQQLYDLVAGWFNVIRGDGSSDIYPRGEVEVTYHIVPRPTDPLHEAQARRMAIDDGVSTAAEYVAKERGIPIEEAQDFVRKNLNETSELRDILSPDDRVAQGREPSSELEIAS